jgi:hypothetical protein
MELEQLYAMIQEDSEIQPDKLDTEALNIPRIHSKYIILLSRETRTYNKLKTELDRLKKKKYNVLSGRATPKEMMESNIGNLKLLKGEYQMYIDTDEEVVKLQSELNDVELLIDTITAFIKDVNQRSYNIKSAIDYLKFKNGIN